MTDKPRIIVIGGPTAVGKSDFAVELAEKVSGEIINLDSVQVYKELNIGAAKPSNELMARVPHHLFDCVSVSQHFDVGSYRELAVQKLNEVIQRERIPVFCGGSTMYLTVLLHGLMSTTPTSTDISFPRHAERSTVELYAELRERDPKRAEQLHPNDRQRIGRAIDLLNSGIMPSEVANAHGFSTSHIDALILIRNIDRELLYKRINERSAAMVRNGIIEETRAIASKFGAVRALSSLGYQQVLEWDGNSKEELSESIAAGTRRYAKRQTTFWRNEPRKRGWRAHSSSVPESEAVDLALKSIENWKAGNASGQELLLLSLT